MEPRGLDFLRPLWSMMQTQNYSLQTGVTQNEEYIGLAPDQVRVNYTTYVNDFKPQFNPLQAGQKSVRTAVNNQLTPGISLSN